jgi:hypothetical protein
MLRGDLVPESRRQQARGAYALRSIFLERLGRGLADAGAEALLVKGAALALTHYPSPWQRPMSDIDLLAPDGGAPRVVAALRAAGCEAGPSGVNRPLTTPAFGETVLVARLGAFAHSVEVHTRLDKVVGRPVDYRAVFSRARPAPELPGLLLPDAVDHALLIVLHLAGHEFNHDLGFVDLDLLLRGDLDPAAFRARAHEWRLGTAAWIALETLVALDAPSARIAAALAATLEPGRARRAAVAACYDVGSYPVARGPLTLGWRWVARQTPLRDDLVGWTAGLARFSLLRARELVRR